MKIYRPGPLVCYLLHFDRPVGRAQHYLGSTFESHLARRLRSHSRAKGASLTAAAVLNGRRIALAHLWPILNRSDEMRAKKNGHLKRLCPICRGDLKFEQAPIITLDSVDLDAWNALLWPGSAVEWKPPMSP